jgi:NADPH-dependent curcumin reductase CurA
MVSQYNLPQEKRYGVKNMMMLFLKRLTLSGFIVSDPHIISKYLGRFLFDMSKWIKSGEIKTKEHITDGIDNAVTGFLGMMKGENFGKAVLKVAALSDNI